MIEGLRDRISYLTAWQARSGTEQKRIALSLLFLALLIPASVWFWINSASGQYLNEKDQIIQRYERALPLAVRVIAAGQGQADATGLSPLAATQQVARDMGIEDKLASIRPSGALQGREGVQIHIENLNLPLLLHLFESLKNQAGLQIISGNLNKRMDNPQRMDVSLVLAR